MAQEIINLGVTANDGTGDSIRRAGLKINNNFTELYARPSVLSDIQFDNNTIRTQSSDANIVLKPSGTGALVFPGITVDDNTIKANRTNDDLKIIPSGSGSLIIDGVAFNAGTTITAKDSSTININEGLVVDGTLTAGASSFVSLALESTLDSTSSTTLSTLTVSGASSLVGTTTIDNLTFNDSIIATSSNADLNLTPGGTGVVNVSNITIDSSINLTDNVIKVIRSNDDFILSASGTGSTKISSVDMNEGTVDNTTIGSATPAAGTFTTAEAVTLNADGVTITDNTVSANSSNANLEFNASGTGYVSVNGINFPNSGGSAGQVLQTDGSGQLSWFSSPILFDTTVIDDGTDTVTGNSVAQTFDSFSASTYRSAKYTIQISDSTANRFALVEANVTHDGSNAYISTYGGADNGTGDGSTVYDPLEFTAIISSGDVRVRAKVNNTNSHVLKFVRRLIKV